MDHVEYGAGFPSATYYAGETLDHDIGTLSSNDWLETKMLDVADRVLDDLANARTGSQFRLCFSTSARATSRS